MGVFDPGPVKPAVYPGVFKFKDALHDSFWTHREWSFTADVQDYSTKLSAKERSVIKNTLLAISNIEVTVKPFWTNLGKRFPRNEFVQVGVVAGENEVRHFDLYSRLLEVLGLNEEFSKLNDVPCIQGRVEYLTKYLKGVGDSSNERFTLTLVLFSGFVERVSLFSQFSVVKAFRRNLNCLKDTENGVQATLKEELLHSLLGAYLINLIRAENPDWFNDEFYAKIARAAKKAYTAECGIIDWIFEAGELDFVPKSALKEYIKQQFNEFMGYIEGPKVFDVDQELLKPLAWMEEEVYGQTAPDFFHVKSVAYAKNTQSFNEEDLF